MIRPYLPFIDWLKALGITLIVYGHVTGAWPLVSLPPVYGKQLGVALFVFATGYSLAGETRPRWYVVFRRLFELYLFGLGMAIVLSVFVYIKKGVINKSNYLPFLAGANVVFDFFPANPTTWYVGMYTHLLLLWAVVLRRFRVTWLILLLVAVVEVVVRAVLIEAAGGYVAYMTISNWMTVLLLGMYYAQRRVTRGCVPPPVALGCLILFLAGWVVIGARVPLDPTFPFMRISGQSGLVATLGVSTVVSVLYATATWLTFSAASHPAPAPVRFLARNTVIVFLVHMPVYYALLSPLEATVPDRTLRASIMLVVCLPMLAALSEGVNRLIQPTKLRGVVYLRLWPRNLSAGSAGSLVGS